MTSMLEVVLYVSDEVAVEARTQASDTSLETETQTQNNQEVRDALAHLNVEVDSVAAAINEMTASVSGINNITTSAATAATDGNALCDQSQTEVHQSSEQVLALHSQLTEASTRLSQLAVKTEQIYSVVDVIQGVSE